MKTFFPLVLVACFIGGGVDWFMHRPGGRFNPHEWFSEITNGTPEQQATGKANYAKCLKERDNGNGLMFCFPPAYTAVIRMSYRKPGDSKTYCTDIDYCVRHGEARILPCQ